MSLQVGGDPGYPTAVTGQVPKKDIDLRDYFAARAMQSWIIAFANLDFESINEPDIARYSYVMADAMLAERNNRTSCNS